MGNRGKRRRDVYVSLAIRVHLLLAALSVLAAACGDPAATSEGTRAVYRDGDDWADDAGG